MGEALDEKEPLMMANVDALVNQTRLLLVASYQGLPQMLWQVE